MTIMRSAGLAALLAVSAAALGGCVDDYGYGGAAVGYGPGIAGYDNYYDGFYGEGPYGDYYPGYYGWYGGYYYPGSGIYVYDRNRRPIRWNNDQRRYWGGQQHAFRGTPGGNGFRPNANWNGFARGNPGGNVGGGAGFQRPSGQAFRGNGGGGFHGGGFHGGGHHR